jgi:hypothetical protein
MILISRNCACRYRAPLLGLFDLDTLFGKIKLVASLVAGAAAELLKADLNLVVLIVLLVMIDTTTGVMGAIRRKDRITSLGLRQTIVKCLEYGALLVGFTLVGNAWSYLQWMSEAAFVYVALTELKSIVENIYGKGSSRYEEILKIRGLIGRAGSAIGSEESKAIAVGAPSSSNGSTVDGDTNEQGKSE